MAVAGSPPMNPSTWPALSAALAELTPPMAMMATSRSGSSPASFSSARSERSVPLPARVMPSRLPLRSFTSFAGWLARSTTWSGFLFSRATRFLAPKPFSARISGRSTMVPPASIEPPTMAVVTSAPPSKSTNCAVIPSALK